MIVTLAYLISTASALPTDASALESAMSALVKDITALDSRSEFWEKVLPWFTGLVAAGLIADVVVVVWERRDEIHARLRWIRQGFHPAEASSAWRFALELFATAAILLGVALELWAGAAIANINGQLRSKNAELRSKSNQLLALVTQEAGDAAASAKTAHEEADAVQGIADEARADAKDALSKAQAAQSELAHAEADAAEAQVAASKSLNTAAEAESHLAGALQRAANAEAELYRLKSPRSLVHSEHLIAALKPFSGIEYTLNVFTDDESIQFTKAFALALHAAGWVRKQPAGVALGIPTVEIVFDQGVAEHVPACIETGISLHAYAKESLATLQVTAPQSLPKTVRAAMALKPAIAQSISPPDERNVATGVIDPKPGEGIPMTICVGKKP
jgi:hypothetical protein